MTDIGKFFSDVDKLLKHTRQANSGKCDYDKVKKDLRSLYDRAANCPTDFPSSLYEYWENEFIYNSPDLSNEPSEDNIGRLGAMVAFLNNSDEYSDLLSAKDWEEMGRLINYEAEDLPVDLLQELMAILVSHGAY